MKNYFQFVLFTNILISLNCDDNNHKYDPGESVVLWVNTVGPYHNPQETYPYYQLPFCKPDHGIATEKRPSGIGEMLEGNILINSGLKLHYPSNVDNEIVCEMRLQADTVSAFDKAITNQYWYELILDDLPMWGMVGLQLRDQTTASLQNEIFTHRTISVAYNHDRIIQVNLTSENPVQLKVGELIRFTYSVKWTETFNSFETRFNQYLEYDFFEHKIHWFSVFNSIMMVIFLCGLVALILLRTIKNDFARYALKEDDIEVEQLNEEFGWKQIHGDVFRAPLYLVLFSSLYGTGCQLLVLILGVILYAICGPLFHGNMYEDRGELVSTVIVCYALSSAVGGYSSGSYYKKYFNSPRAESKSQWQKTMICTVSFFPGLILIILICLNTLALCFNALNIISLGIIAKMMAIWFFVSLPLSVIGTILGRHWSGKYDVPCRVNSISRPIPETRWYLNPVFLILTSGLLPFGSIFIEMYFVFTAFWSYKFYYVYGFLLLVYSILVVVTTCTSIVSVYFLLNSENHHWQWLSFMCSGSTSVYVFLYSIYYFFYKTQMSGLLQISFYFGYMFIFSLSLFLMGGAIGVSGASAFVHKIYKEVKID